MNASKRTANWTIKEAVAVMPMCLLGGFDSLQHKTLEDLHFLAQHEMDLHDEGEIKLTSRERSLIIGYMGKLRAAIAKARGTPAARGEKGGG